jgi:hypothetical protein
VEQRRTKRGASLPRELVDRPPPRRSEEELPMDVVVRPMELVQVVRLRVVLLLREDLHGEARQVVGVEVEAQAELALRRPRIHSMQIW